MFNVGGGNSTTTDTLNAPLKVRRCAGRDFLLQDLTDARMHKAQQIFFQSCSRAMWR